eukprot:scaffold111936_cov19-Tisochrysis_lutea.AAC.2
MPARVQFCFHTQDANTMKQNKIRRYPEPTASTCTWKIVKRRLRWQAAHDHMLEMGNLEAA